jgi:molybdopterin molybdotransferase
MISIEQATTLIDSTAEALPTEEISLSDAVGRVLAKEILADVDSPPHRKSVMDGFAVRSDEIKQDCKLSVIETVIAGGVPTKTVEAGQATRIMTGAPMPEGADAVVMIELTNFDEAAGQVTIQVDQIKPGHHAMDRGTNFQKGATIFEQGHRVRALDIGLLAEVGAANCLVYRRPRVAVLPTGNELVDCGVMPSDGQIRNSNGPMLASMLEHQGLEVSDLGIGLDEPNQLRSSIERGLEHDLLLLSGGVSAGTMDLVPTILNELGVEQVFHKVMVKPGKPIYFGVLRTNDRCTYVFGLPGNPVSSLVGCRLFVARAISILMGVDSIYPQAFKIALSKDHEARGNRPTYWPGRLVGSTTATRMAEPLNWNGSSDLMTLGTAEGLIAFPEGTNVHPVGSEFDFYPLV